MFILYHLVQATERATSPIYHHLQNLNSLEFALGIATAPQYKCQDARDNCTNVVGAWYLTALPLDGLRKLDSFLRCSLDNLTIPCFSGKCVWQVQLPRTGSNYRR